MMTIVQVVRIFTSSTFTDMLMERNTLMEFVYPRIREYCRERYGIEFQVQILCIWTDSQYPGCGHALGSAG